MGIRETQKQETRARVLAAARDLFDEVGYEGATIRLVAQRAGVAIGSVFTTFSSKADILSQVMQERVERLVGKVDHLPAAMSARQRIKATMAVYYREEMQRPRLMLAHIVSAFTPDQEAGVIPFGVTEAAVAGARQALTAAAQQGEIAADADIDLIIDLLRGIYAWNYRLAAREGADAETLIARADRQIDLLFDGLAPR